MNLLNFYEKIVMRTALSILGYDPSPPTILPLEKDVKRAIRIAVYSVDCYYKDDVVKESSKDKIFKHMEETVLYQKKKQS